MLLQPRPSPISPALISPHPRSSSFTFFTPSVITNMIPSSAPTSPQLTYSKRASLVPTSMNENVPSASTPTNALHTISVVSVASHPLPQQQAVRIDMKLRIPISLFTPTQQTALSMVKQREMMAMKKRKRAECTLKGCTCVSCKEDIPIKQEENIETTEVTTTPTEITSISSATSAFKKLKSTSTPSSPSPYDDDHLSTLDLPTTFRNHKSWYANPFNTKKPPKHTAAQAAARVAAVRQKDGDTTTSTSPVRVAAVKQKDVDTTTTSPPRHLSPPIATQSTTSPRQPSPFPHSLASTGLLSTDYVYRDVNVVIPATSSSMDVSIQIHKHSVKIRCAGHTLVTLNAHHLFTF